MKIIIKVTLFIVLLFLLKKCTSKSQFTPETPTVALVTLIYKPKSINDWLKRHREFGISHFYIRLEDTPELIEYLTKQPDVTLMVASNNADSNQFISLQKRQIDTVNKVIKMCKQTFLIHTDCDEILSGNIQEITNLPDSIGTFWMQNYEAKYANVPSESDTCFQAKHLIDCSKETCSSYINGKGGCRVSAPGVHLVGPHRFKSNLRDTKINVIVEHYESCDFQQYIKKYTRLSNNTNTSDINAIPFKYYRESILANGSTKALSLIYKKFRVAS